MDPQGKLSLQTLRPVFVIFKRCCGSINSTIVVRRDQGLKYNVTAGDEVEDMFALLSEVKRQIPSISAVSSGAIASDYQRLRVESVCSRLGLVSLAYLWKQDQTLLLEEMVPWKSSFFYNCMNYRKKHVHSVLLWSLMLTDKKGHCGNNCKGMQCIHMFTIINSYSFG